LFDKLTTQLPGQKKTLADLMSQFFSPENLPLKARLINAESVSALEVISFDLAGQHPMGNKLQILKLQQQREYIGINVPLKEDHVISASDYMDYWIGEKRVNGVSQDGLARVEFLKGLTGAGLQMEEESRRSMLRGIMGGP
jgi:hypothetical protein